MGTVVAVATALGLGVICGLVAGDRFGPVHPERVRRAVGRLRSSSDDPERTSDTEREIHHALRSDGRTRALRLGVRALGGGLVELTGTAPDEVVREAATAVTSGVPGVDVVVNRILVEGADTDAQPAATITPGS